MREGIIKRTPMELLRAVIEERDAAGCDVLHELHADKPINDCNGRVCSACIREAMSKAADLVEAELDALKARALPEGMELDGLEILKNWPRFEDGEPVRIGNEVHIENEKPYPTFDMLLESITISSSGFSITGADCEYVEFRAGERVKRPAPKVLDADGVEVEVGDDLYSVEGMLKFHVSHVDRANGKIATDAMFALDKWADPKMYTHRAPVLAADGEPLLDGDEVWRVKNGDGPYHVQEIRDDASVCVGETWREFRPDELTHERPVADTWERIEEDARLEPPKYADRYRIGRIGFEAEDMRVDLVRRAKKLAEKEV